MNWYFAAAGGISAVWLVVHLTAGERDVARPFLAVAALDPVVRETQYLCWHFTSVAIGCMALFLGGAAATGMVGLAIAGVALAAGFAVVGVGLVVARGARHRDVPQGWLFVPVAALGLTGLLL